MTDLNERVENLEEVIDELALDLHASKVAITILSTTLNSMGKEPGLLANSFLEARKIAPPIEFENPTQEGYEEKLIEKVATLLSKVN
ncbi:hypothetical protein [Enterobacter cloacae]|uniref:hypothetical protein n=1 Tax=Enterobacter cloacae TaxID=550 RepID=UPI000BA07B89|nr:hypothetical protein CIW55_09515 [Enterobacter cloacae]